MNHLVDMQYQSKINEHTQPMQNSFTTYQGGPVSQNTPNSHRTQLQYPNNIINNNCVLIKQKLTTKITIRLR